MLTKKKLLAEIEGLHDRMRDTEDTVRDLTFKNAKLKKRIDKQRVAEKAAVDTLTAENMKLKHRLDMQIAKVKWFEDRAKIIEGALGDYEDAREKVGDYVSLGHRLTAVEGVLKEHIHEAAHEAHPDTEGIAPVSPFAFLADIFNTIAAAEEADVDEEEDEEDEEDEDTAPEAIHFMLKIDPDSMREVLIKANDDEDA